MKKFLIVVLVIVAGIQLFRPERSNPPVTGEIDAIPAVVSVFRRACYDCHSHQTEWPWYSNVAPVSWLVSRDVKEGRKHLNFSTWLSLSASQREHAMEEIWEEITVDNMPPWYYARMHGNSTLTNEDRRILRRWIRPAS